MSALLAVLALYAGALPDVAAVQQCKDSLDVPIFVSPKMPHAKAPLKVIVVAGEAFENAEIAAIDPDGNVQGFEPKRYGGPPYGWVVSVEDPKPGKWRFAFGEGANVVSCQDTFVRYARAKRSEEREGGDETVWKARFKWERDVENFYSVWIEHLFEAPLDEDVSWRPLHEVLRNPERNLLYDHLGYGEDGPGRETAFHVAPDCADFPYTLRAYFAWKISLPFGYRACRRGTKTRAPRCGELRHNEQKARKDGAAAAMADFLRRTIPATIHSSTLRTLPEDEKSDLYPVAMTRSGLRPGAVFSDPYGHTMVLASWIPPKDDAAGVLLAVDAQPDGTIGRRYFWKGSFLFPEEDAVAGAGFKRFRPVHRNSDGELVPMTNAEIAASIDYGDFSTEQWKNGRQAFYDRMDELITPRALPPEVALKGIVDALDQQIRRRVESVELGEEWKRENAGKTMKMPNGPAIFITDGPWEAFSTPSRDMRLLIAIDTINEFPERIVRLPHRYTLAPGQTPKQAREAMLIRLKEIASERTFTYRRSDGSEWTLSMADVMARTERFEMAYNPNDCIEERWAAEPGSEEHATCETHAPDSQREKMESYREWFRTRERPR